MDVDKVVVEERLQKAVNEIKNIGLENFINASKNIQKITVYCKNCKRSVYVGKCCNNPDLEVTEHE